MTKPIRVSINLPFPGFYHSVLSEAVDYEESRHIEDRVNEGDNEADELQQPEPLRLTASKLGDIYIDNTDYSIAYAELAKNYLAAFDCQISGALDVKLDLQFEEVTSPKYYNFETDRLFANLPLKAVRELFKRSAAEDHATLARVIKDRFTSYDGFYSYYVNDLKTWLEKPVRDWDVNEIGTLLIAAIFKAVGGDENGYTSVIQAIEYAAIEDEGAYYAWEEAVNWEALEKAIGEARDEKLADLAGTDPELWASLSGQPSASAPAPRDPNTPDLF